MEVQGKNILGFSNGEGAVKTFRTYNPKRNEENHFVIEEATEEMAYESVRKAHLAWEAYRFMPISRRAEFLRKIAESFRAERVYLEQIFCLESGLSEKRAAAELDRTCFQLEHFAKAIEQNQRLLPSESDSDEACFLNKRFLSLGPVVVFGASNFPFAYSTMGGDSASALAAGCPVIVKGHEMHAGTGDLVAQLVNRAAKETKMPDGVFSNLNAKGHWLGAFLVKHELVKAVGFTGSIPGGMALYQIAQNRKEPIPFFAEMGSVNPIVVLPQKLKDEKEQLVTLIRDSMTLDAGQFCTNPGLVIGLASSEWDYLVHEMSAAVKAIAPQVMVHPDLYEKYYGGLERNVLLLQEKGVNVELPEKTGIAEPFMVELSAETFVSSQVLAEEVFGLHTLFVRCKDEAQLLEVLNNLAGQLTCSVFASDSELKQYRSVFEWGMSHAGRMVLNGVPTGVTVDRDMHHGGPFPASSDSRFTAVGSDAIARFLRPICFQGFSEKQLKELIS
ncbi:MAG: aldehyde dehydrogenase (NADP(+)) [Bacteroidetes bacterium]|nr:MAG: aldehyde dehydrogenase (NADP(+)) [Bacteroidota bacterium]